MVRYNENDPFAARWLRNLIASGCIADGEIDARDIQEVKPDDVREADQFHAFAGIGGWSLALRLANWPDHVGVWTGSCPCQPFSAAGKKEGFSDERHLWPEWFRLIQECRPPIIFGEQVASPDGVRWLDTVFSDLEGAGYACGAADLCAASIGAPHIRQRLFFVAYSVSAGRPERWTGTGERPFTGGLTTSIVADTKDADRRRAGIPADTRRRSEEVGGSGATCDMAHPKRDGRNKGSEMLCGREPKPSNSGGLGNAGGKRLEGRQGEQGDYGQKLTAIERTGNTTCPLADTGGSQRRTNPEGRGDVDNRTDTGWEEATGGHAMDSPYDGSWSDAEWLPCTDGKSRPVEPGTFPLAPSLPISMGRMQPELRQLAELDGLHTQSLTRAKGNRVGRLTGYGNSIVPQVAATFIRAFMEIERNGI